MKLLSLRRGGGLVVVVLAFAHGLVGHGVAKAMEIADLQGRWTLVAVNQQPVRPGTPVFFEINGLKINGFDGCNSFGGQIDKPSQIVMSQRACASGVQMLPLQLSDPLPQLKAARLVNEHLVVPLVDGSGEALFRR